MLSDLFKSQEMYHLTLGLSSKYEALFGTFTIMADIKLGEFDQALISEIFLCHQP